MMLPEPVWPVVVLAGISVALLGLVTTLALVLYFVVAVAMHIAARDLGRDLFVNATAC